MICYVFLGILAFVTAYRGMSYIRISKTAASNDHIDEYLVSAFDKGGKHERKNTSQAE